MVNATHKAERITTNARLKAKLQAKASSQVSPFDAARNMEQKRDLQAFWATHAEAFTRWWQDQADGDAVHALVDKRPAPPNQHIQSTSPALVAAHDLLLPELSAQWLCASVAAEPMGRPPMKALPRGLVWLMKTHAAAIQEGVHTDDVHDLGSVKGFQSLARDGWEM